MPVTLDDITAALALPPLGARSDFDLNPGLMPGVGAPAKNRPAAVLCPLIERAGELRVVLTVRAATLRHHAGQISFPGGKVDAADTSPRAAALREADEEIGLLADQVEILGQLDPYHTSTGFRVAPFVGLINPAWQALIDPEEVEEIFETPIDFLMDPGNHQRHSRDWQGAKRYYYAMPWGDYYIWGATAGMLKGLSDRLARLRGEAS